LAFRFTAARSSSSKVAALLKRVTEAEASPQKSFSEPFTAGTHEQLLAKKGLYFDLATKTQKAK
jgi:hypothetical protein